MGMAKRSFSIRAYPQPTRGFFWSVLILFASGFTVIAVFRLDTALPMLPAAVAFFLFGLCLFRNVKGTAERTVSYLRGDRDDADPDKGAWLVDVPTIRFLGFGQMIIAIFWMGRSVFAGF